MSICLVDQGQGYTPEVEFQIHTPEAVILILGIVLGMALSRLGRSVLRRVRHKIVRKMRDKIIILSWDGESDS